MGGDGELGFVAGAGPCGEFVPEGGVGAEAGEHLGACVGVGGWVQRFGGDLPAEWVRRFTWQNASELYRHDVPEAVIDDPNSY